METANLEQLTEKIYREAIEKAEAEVSEMMNEANAKAQKIVSEAEEEAQQNIIAKATKEAQLLRSSTESELQLQGKRLISDLKREITDLISDKILTKNIKAAFEDPKFYKEILLELVKNWGKEDVLELQVPENTRGKIDKAFEKEIAANIKDLNVTFNNQISGGFKVSKKGDSYQISFTDEDFIAFFQSYLSGKTRDLLFDNKV